MFTKFNMQNYPDNFN